MPEWSSGFPYFLQFKSEFGNKEFMIWATVSSWSWSQSNGLSSSHVCVQMWELDHKKTEHGIIDAFKLWCWRRLLRVPWNARKSNQSILKEISPEYSLEGLMLKLKLQYSGHLMQRTDTLEKTLMLGKDWRWEEKGMTEDEMIDDITNSTDMSKLQELVVDREIWRAAVHEVTESQTRLTH